jgi:hypothetical protein
MVTSWMAALEQMVRRTTSTTQPNQANFVAASQRPALFLLPALKSSSIITVASKSPGRFNLNALQPRRRLTTKCHHQESVASRKRRSTNDALRYVASPTFVLSDPRSRTSPPCMVIPAQGPGFRTERRTRNTPDRVSSRAAGTITGDTDIFFR